MISTKPHEVQDYGAYTADQLRSGDPYELSRGRCVVCNPTGGDGTGPNGRGFMALDTDPKVTQAGVDAGFEFGAFTMRAPDVAVGDFAENPGWIRDVPSLAVEYASVGQNEAALREKIDDLGRAGVRYLWVVRLAGPRRVEVYENGQLTRSALPGETLSAPNVLQNPVPVEALYDRAVAHKVAFQNLLQREGYRDLDDVRAEMLAHQFERKLKRPLTAGERATLQTRVAALGVARVSDVVLDESPDALTAWLARSDAR
jgi:Uma2 family endonuclease